MSIGSNFVAVPDGVYVFQDKTCLRLDPQTGKTMSEFKAPRGSGDDEMWSWGHIVIWKDFLVAGVSPAIYEADVYFSKDDFHRTKNIDTAVAALRELENFEFVEKAEGENDLDFLVKNLNKLMDDEKLAEKLSMTVNPDAKDKKRGNRRLLDEHFSLAQDNPVYPRQPGARGYWSGTASKGLVVMNRHTGKVLWTAEAENYFWHNGIAVGANRIYCIDEIPGTMATFLRRRGKSVSGARRLLAFDINTGKVVWKVGDALGMWVAYSEEHDIVFLGARTSRDMLPDYSYGRMRAYGGKDGSVLWDKPTDAYGGPCMLVGDRIITNRRVKTGRPNCLVYDLLTGELRPRKHPLTGESIPWGFAMQYGCGTAVAAQGFLLFRSGAAGYFDLAHDSGSGNFGGFRAGCSSNLIAANGVLSAPDYTRQCICRYQNQTSLAMVHMPEVETWTVNKLEPAKEPLECIGINFGAPGDRWANGTLWLEYPIVGGPSPDIPITIKPEAPQYFRLHSAYLKGQGLKWIAASGCKGAKSITINSLRNGAYTVRLHFAEPDEIGPEQRVLDIALQGREVLKDFDIVREAGGPHRAVVKEYTGVKVKKELTLTLDPSQSTELRDTVICGIEVVDEEWAKK